MSTSSVAGRPGHSDPPSDEINSATNSKLTLVATASNSNAVAETAKSAAAETTVAPPAANDDPVGEAIKRCKAVANGKSVFKASAAHIFEALNKAYPTFLLVKDNETEHQRVIDELMAEGNRERMPSLRKAALNSTVLASHPGDPDDWGLCSDWANVLTLADLEKVPAENFRTWVEGKSIREAKRKVREAKKANKPLKTPFTEGDFPALAYVLNNCADMRFRQAVADGLSQLNSQASETLAALNIPIA